MKRKKNKFKVREFKDRVLICCEGLTEKNYFSFFKEDVKAGKTVRVSVLQSGNSDCKGVVKEAVKKAKKEKFEKVFVVFDHDNQSNRKEAFELARKNNFTVIFSSICFEYWYLLHFKRTTKVYSSEAHLESDLKKNNDMKNYQKNDKNHYNILKDKTDIAIENTQNLKIFCKENLSSTPIYNWNPYTNVDDLVSYILSQAKK